MFVNSSADSLNRTAQACCRNVPMVIIAIVFCNTFKVKRLVSHTQRVFSLNMAQNVNLAMFYYIGCTYLGTPENKCLMSGAHRCFNGLALIGVNSN